MDKLRDTVCRVMKEYARKGLNSHSHFIHNDDYTVLSVITISDHRESSFISLLVELRGQTVVIERDQNDKSLVEALVQADVSRKQIVLAYAGEGVPAAV